ncbi:MAG: hypothetical protein J1G05_05125 [Clostridiales bacterium]|nr:hypothetical protein [Clostridiales bacterium]
MRKGLGIIAVTLAASCVFMAGCSSCNSKGKNVSPLASNWYTYTGYKNIQPTFIWDGESELKYKEQITYDVTFKKPSLGNSTYSVNYENGTYSTEFYARKFDDDTLIHEDHKSGYEGKNIISYYYRTEFSATVTYKFGSKESDPLESNITTESYFLSVEDELRPLYSKQVVKGPSPAALQAQSLSDCYTLFDGVYETFYSYNGKSAISQITDNLNTKNNRTTTKNVGGTSNSLFDVTSLEIVLRALIGSGFNQTIALYTPLNGINSFTLSSPSTSLGTQKGAIATALMSKGLYIPADDEANIGDGLQTTAVSVTSNSQLKGVSQTYWFAKVDKDNKLNNTGRATLLKISLPIVFNLGTLEYTLKEVTSTLWDE